MSDTLPFRQYVLKVASRCDLACDHCYVYEAADSSWRGQPKRSAAETLLQTAIRIAEHTRANDVRAVQVVLHGGEPLLAGKERLRFAAATLHREIGAAGTALDLRIHTNGVLLDAEFCDIFAEYAVRVGISLDGDRAANDRHRRYADGRTSHPQVLRALDLLRRDEYRHLYAGLLCTVDILNDPVAVYEALKAAEPPRCDLLLPHATHDAPPNRPDGTSYAAWLLTIHERWQADGKPFPIRLFESVDAALRGGPSTTESLGLEPVGLVVIETDGTLEQVDSLKAAYDGAAATGFDVFHDTLDTAAGHPGFAARRNGLTDLCETCRQCPVVGACGGGLRTHRFRTDGQTGAAGFDHPSVYCADLKELIMGIRTQTRREAAAWVPEPTNHALSAAAIDALASGYGDAEAIGMLAGHQRSLRRGLLGQVAGLLGAGGIAAWHLLASLDRVAPETVDDVLAHPFVRTWAVACASGRSRNPEDLRHLAAIAAAVAIRAGLSADVEVPVLAGAVHLPTLGRLPIGGPGIGGSTEGRSVRLHIEDGACSILRAPAWQPLRRITAGPLSLALEDTDPYRACHQYPVTGRLSPDGAEAWERAVASAWSLIRTDLPAYAPGLAEGLTAVVPLAPAPTGRDVSATARQAFGSVGAALPADPATLALLLVHEFQHVKLGAVLDIADLYDHADARLFHAPWREDPRPLEGLFQGTYAHIAVTEFWRSRGNRTQFTRWRDHTAAAIETLRGSGSLTPLGERFADGMRGTVEPWLGE